MLLSSVKKPLKNYKKGTMTKEYVEINDVRQGLIIESLNQGKPLLLFLHGGPGFPVYPILKAYGIRLEQYFDVCYWDQRGTGMSYDAKETRKPLTVEQLVEDALQVTNYLREKYSHDKIFLLGHSWGTYLGSIVASKHPELFHAYIGVGQIGSFTESEREAYNYILKKAEEHHDKRALQKIKSVPFDENYYTNHAYGTMKTKYANKYGVGFMRSGYSAFDNVKHAFLCPNYSFKERVNIIRGNFYSFHSLRRELANNDLVELVPELKLPVYLFHGIHDYQTTYNEAKRFYESLQAPFKKMYTFYQSAHTPYIEEKQRFFKMINQDVLSMMESEG